MARLYKVTMMEVTSYAGEYFTCLGVGFDRSPLKAYNKAWDRCMAQPGSEYSLVFRNVERVSPHGKRQVLR